MIWDFFDQIFCINLYSRDDRLIKSKEIFDKLNIPVKYFRVNKHPISGEIGCFESHLQLINYGFETGCDHIMIFEDDFIPSPFYSEDLIKKAINFMENNTDWEIFYFGHQPDIFFNSSTNVSPNIIKTHSTLNHSYAVSKRLMKKLYKMEYKGEPIDKLFLKNEHSYALYPMTFYQDDLESDIPTSKPIRYMRFFEIYSYYINYSVVEISFFLILLFAIFWIYIFNIR